jgi:hypothetical protein
MHKTYSKLLGFRSAIFNNYFKPESYVSNVMDLGTDPYFRADYGSGQGRGDSYVCESGNGHGGGILYGRLDSGDGGQDGCQISLEESHACFIC